LGVPELECPFLENGANMACPILTLKKNEKRLF
jgi:hypothetical protein